ncbi:MAG TPA: PxKF domain-containing protein [Gaiellaceae bacterium]|nr:PxKF domain-containing protein [Gaiellaceae bacterium]
MWRALLSLGTLSALIAAAPIGAAGGPDPRNAHPPQPGAASLEAAAAALDWPPFAIVSNGTVRLGINPQGHLDAGDLGGGGGGETLTALEPEDVGLEFVPTGGDALIPGCYCEGWGIASAPSGLSGYASVANGGISPNLVVTAFNVTADTAESIVEIAGRLRVRHVYTPSASPSLYRVDVSVENIGAVPAPALVYRRAMDWDVPPTEFDEFVTLQGAAPYLLDSTNDGFAFVDPLVPLSDLGHRGTFVDAGPFDHGAAFDLSLGDLAPGESTGITLFYGAAATETQALGALASVGAQVYSLGQPNTPDGARLGTPNTFAFGIRGACEDDTDCDYLTNAVEANQGTDPNDPDTDGDGLLDSWEMPTSVPGSGFHGPGFESYSPTLADVFGPFESGICLLPEQDLRLNGQVTCFNQPPNPLRKDVFLELDWQDCRFGSCPEILGLNVDPLHHAPNLPALGRITDVFDDAPVSNPTATSGVALHILIDEAIPHAPNCDQGESSVRPDRFGTAEQRANANATEILAAKEAAVRYVWSGHSSHSNSGAACPNPDGFTFFKQGAGFSELADYDWSPFGDVDVGGRDLLLTLGPIWSCSAEIKLNSDSPFLGPCYRQIKIIQTWFGFGSASVVPIPGIFPAKIRDEHGNQLDVRWPINQLLGVGESAGITQLWARALTHLLGHALGLPDDASVRNQPGVPGASDPDSFASWQGLNYAPGQGTGSLQESFPDYVGLAAQDLDGDGVPEGEDNCAGVSNPEEDGRQPDWDFDDIGNACDQDLDGDNLGSSSSGLTGLLAAVAELIQPAGDPFPLDTDNDGLDNDVDADDDNDGVPDAGDGCPVVADPLQADTDGDGLGDACDLDDDGDSNLDALETATGSDPLDPLSVPEVMGGGGTACSDGGDNDRDGLVDGADGGCRDADGDRMPDDLDNCPSAANDGDHWSDGDGDGLGDACDGVVDDATVTVDAVLDAEVGPADAGTGVAWHADRDGRYAVLLGGGGCDAGLQIDSGTYTAPVSLLTTIPAALLSDGPNTVRACLSTSAGTFSATATVVRTADGFEFEGFFPPVDNPPVRNSMTAGAAVPVKFSLGGDFGLDILAPGSPSSQSLACETGVPVDPVEQTVTASQSGLQFDAATDRYTYVWKTQKAWAGTCRRLIVELTDGSVHDALFVFK